MCTVVTLCRPGHAWPLLLAANRDEKVDRAWDAPAPWWPDRPGLVGGRDREAGGTWMATGPCGVVACVLNRPASLGPAPGKQSRGVLPLLAAGATDAAAGAARIAALDARRWRSFNLLVADRTGVWFVCGEEAGHPRALPLAPGTHMVTAFDPDDARSPRTVRHLPRFRAAPPADPGADDWAPWRALLAERNGAAGEAINVPWRNGFGTVCSSLLALGADGAMRWLFCPAPPDCAAFAPVAPAGPTGLPRAAGQWPPPRAVL